MTFYEAAIEVLRQHERPLHVKKITEISIKRQLLSHVGRDPAQVMVDRLNLEVAKGEEGALIQPRQGVFDLKSEVRERLNHAAKLREEEERNREMQEATLEREAQSAQKGNSFPPDLASLPLVSRNLNEPLPPYVLSEETLKTLLAQRYETIEDAAYAVLQTTNGIPLHISQLTKCVFENKLVRFHTHNQDVTLHAALTMSSSMSVDGGCIGRFDAYADHYWGLTEWRYSTTNQKRIKELETLVEDLRKETATQIGDQLRQLRTESFEMILIALLQRLGYSEVKVSKRTGSGDVYMTGTAPKAFNQMRVCIQYVGNVKNLVDAKTVEGLRSNLAHYKADEGILVYLGSVGKDAVAAAKSIGKVPVSLLDEETFVGLLIDNGIGILTHQQSFVTVDRGFFSSFLR